MKPALVLTTTVVLAFAATLRAQPSQDTNDNSSGKVVRAEFSPDGKHVVTTAPDNTVRIWDAATGKPISATVDESTLTKVGDKSPVVSVRTIDGQDVVFHDRVVVLNFFATWCGPCMLEMPHLEKDLWQPLKDKGVILISVGREHSVAEVKKFKQQKGYSFLFAADPKREIFCKFATQSIPRCVVVGRDGRIKFQSVGFEGHEVASLVKAVQSELEK